MVRVDFMDEMRCDLSFEEWIECILKENVGHFGGREQDAQKLNNLSTFDIYLQYHEKTI